MRWVWVLYVSQGIFSWQHSGLACFPSPARVRPWTPRGLYLARGCLVQEGPGVQTEGPRAIFSHWPRGVASKGRGTCRTTHWTDGETPGSRAASGPGDPRERPPIHLSAGNLALTGPQGWNFGEPLEVAPCCEQWPSLGRQ